MPDSPHDQEAREQALNPRESFHLEAPAGSGKTAVLLARFLTLLGRVHDSPREILALTFTRKATGEFLERAMKYFRGPEDLGAPLPPHEQLLYDLAGQAYRHLDGKNLAQPYLSVPERLPVNTFHGFCTQLLKAAPHEAGVPLEFQLPESDREEEWQKQEALEELRRRLNARSGTDQVRQALVRRLVRLNNNWKRLAQELRDLLSRRDTLKDFLALAQESVREEDYAALMEHRLSQALAHILKPLAAGLLETELGRRWPQFLEVVQSNGTSENPSLPAQPPGASFHDLDAWQSLAEVLLTKTGGLRKRWPAKVAASDWPDLLAALPPDFLVCLKDCRTLPRQLFASQEVGAIQDLILLLGAALSVYDDFCRQRRVLDFIAVEEAALKLLNVEEPGELLLRLDWQLRHILVDEFQDTSDNQKELLCRLLAGWSKGDGRTLTVVGDPKQSIYGWRKARLDLFLETRFGLTCGERQTLPLMPLSLTTNFRATPTLITWVNRVFGGTVMADHRLSGGLEFAEAYPGPAATGGEDPCLALFAGEDNHEARAREAHWLANTITAALPTLPAGERLAILLFARTHLSTYLSALQKAGLVPRVREGLKLTESRVVKHLHNLARALVRPQDDVAWAAALTGPWTTPDLAVLATCAQIDGAVWPEKIKAFLAEGSSPDGLAEPAQLLLAARERVGREPLAITVERFLNEAAAWRDIAAWEGALGVACARTYLNLLADSEEGLPESTFLKADFALEGAYQPPDPRAEDSPVEVLTVHGAKGLEFHTVFLPFLDWQPLKMEGNLPPPFLLEEIPGTRAHVLGLAPPAWLKGADSSYRLVRNLKTARLLAEARRVFYVAVTRARAQLFLSGVLPTRQGAWAPPAKDSPLAWLWQHYRPGDLTSGPLVWNNPRLQVEPFPDTMLSRRDQPELRSLPHPWSFAPEPPPYRLAFPSQAADKPAITPAPEAAGADEDNLAARARGEVIHRLLQTQARGDRLPGVPGVAAALVGLGVPRDLAQSLAPEILRESEACLEDPFLKKLLTPDSAVTEWGLEDQPVPGAIRRGRLDLLAFDGRAWWLVDFKSSRPQPGESWEDFLVQEQEKYRPQLRAYGEMTAKVKGFRSPEDIRLALYFTAARKLVEV